MRDFIAGDADQSLETAAKAILSRSFREVTKHWPQDIYTGQRLFEGYLKGSQCRGVVTAERPSPR